MQRSNQLSYEATDVGSWSFHIPFDHKNCVNTKKTTGNGMFSNKEVCADGISLRVETRIALLDEKHLIDETVKFSFSFTFLGCGIGFL